MQDRDDITRLLAAVSAGKADARNALYESVYTELRLIASAHRRRWHGNDTMNTTALIHEAYVKIAAPNDGDFASRAHFFATASKAMRQVLIDYAERANAAKRGGAARPVTLDDNVPGRSATIDELLQLEQLLKELEKDEPRHARIVECRVFGGLTIDETATALDVSPATIKRDWALVSAWLYRELHGADKPAP